MRDRESVLIRISIIDQEPRAKTIFRLVTNEHLTTVDDHLSQRLFTCDNLNQQSCLVTAPCLGNTDLLIRRIRLSCSNDDRIFDDVDGGGGGHWFLLLHGIVTLLTESVFLETTIISVG